MLISNACQNLAHIKILNFKESHSYLDTYAIKSKIKRLSDSVELKKKILVNYVLYLVIQGNKSWFGCQNDI